MLPLNIGIVNGYDALPIVSHARVQGTSGYRGEFYLQNSPVLPKVVSWVPDRWVVRTQVDHPDVLVVNQNFDPGWRTVSGEKPVDVNGLLGVPVAAGVQEVQLYYMPFSFLLGLWVCLAGLVLIGWDIFNLRYRSNG